MILTRPMRDEDRQFVLSGWSSSYRASRDETAPMALYAKHKHEEVNFYLERCRTLVAHGDLGVLFGFIAYDPSTYVATISRRRVTFDGYVLYRRRETLDGYVLYVYVAAPFRRRGIATRLFAAAGISPLQRFGFACRTQWSAKLRVKIPNAEHEPNRARYEEITTHGRHAARQEQQTAAGESEGADADPTDQDLAP